MAAPGSSEAPTSSTSVVVSAPASVILRPRRPPPPATRAGARQADPQAEGLIDMRLPLCYREPR